MGAVPDGPDPASRATMSEAVNPNVPSVSVPSVSLPSLGDGLSFPQVPQLPDGSVVGLTDRLGAELAGALGLVRPTIAGDSASAIGAMRRMTCGAWNEGRAELLQHGASPRSFRFSLDLVRAKRWNELGTPRQVHLHPRFRLQSGAL